MAEDSKKSGKEKAREEKADRLSDALRENLRKRKQLQRDRGAGAPDAIKNKNRLTD
ncbi:hypothetical protein [Sneathiella sp. P13V-1]|uniref:hypothetical protein n=1 Tax=Sneathiella sp. P13V-1 TaxID=2697366 RepID=UPI00187B9173|nr:hypothetical protein [Sneathiella sp. P13V-1]